MPIRPSLVRSVPFWILLAGSLASTAVGAWLVLDKLSVMTTTLSDGSATGVEVYAGQSWAALGAVLVGAGLVGFALALVVAVLAGALRPAVPVAPAAAPGEWTEGSVVEEVEEPAAPATHAEPAVVTPSEPIADAAPAADAPASDGPAQR